jgi:3-polyprenyl-4-hydroxybenzoate decarboxylase
MENVYHGDDIDLLKFPVPRWHERDGGRYIGTGHDIKDVLWAMCSRADPLDSAEILRRCWSGPLDPIIPPERKGSSSRMIIDACRPFEWRDKFPPAAEISAERQQAVMNKWKEELFS